MKISDTGLGITKIENLDAMYPAQDLLIKTGQIYQYASGVFGLHNIPLKVKQNVEQIIRDEFEKNGIIEVSLPLIHPKSTWERSNRYNTYVDEGIMLITDSNHGTFCLQPTAEEAIIEFAETKLSSYKQLPVILYQMNEKFRNEIRNRGYMLRGKAFTMMDAYSFDESFEGLEVNYEKVKKCYLNIFKKLNLNVLPVAATSGSIGGSKSEEFMLISKLGEDTILYNKEKNLALNIEILELPNYETILKEKYDIDSLDGFVETKSIELGHVFQLGTIYSEKMNSNFTAKDESKKPFVMGCYGIGVSRTVATIFEENVVMQENKAVGYSLPLEISPYLGSIISTEEKKEIAEKLYNNLESKNTKVILDDRYDKKTTFGVKLKEALTYGVPYLFILGNKCEVDEIIVENVKTNKTFTIKLNMFEKLANTAFNQKITIEELLDK